MRLSGGVITLNGAQQNLGTLLAALIPAGGFARVKVVTLQPYSTNANPVYYGKSDLAGQATATGYLGTGNTSISFSGGPFETVDLSSIYLFGTNAEKVHVTVL